MKNLTTKLMIAAVALAAVSAASAQVLKADIPFAFQAGGTVLPAGTYRVDLRGPLGTVLIETARRNSAVMVHPAAGMESKNVTARLVFQCGHGPCVLVQAWGGTAGSGRQFHAPKPARDEDASLYTVRLRPEVAE